MARFIKGVMHVTTADLGSQIGRNERTVARWLDQGSVTIADITFTFTVCTHPMTGQRYIPLSEAEAVIKAMWPKKSEDEKRTNST